MGGVSPALAATGARAPLVAVAGNPNTGKTTLFNRLTGSDQKVGNYAGVTVERHAGTLTLPSGRSIELVDVPGAYSLSARSREEELAIQVVAGLPPYDAPDLVVLVVDATQLSRNLYMVLQVLELELPAIVALNMSDVLLERGEELDARVLESELGVPVVVISALHGRGLEGLTHAIERTLAEPARARPGARTPAASGPLAEDLRAVEAHLPRAWTLGSAARERALAAWALLSLDDADELRDVPRDLRAVAEERRRRAQESGRQIELELVRARFDWVDARMARFVKRPAAHADKSSERVDAVLLNPWLGFPIFLLLMALVFQALFAWAEPAMDAIDGVFGAIAELAKQWIPAGLAQEFVTDALIAGAGSVVVFLPQILLLFLFIGLLEDTGYMARVAFLMDRIMRMMGLNGRAFVPMLSGYACAVPAILATRTMERQRDRTLTMMVIPLMTCSARLPVYTLVIGALFAASAGFSDWTPSLLMVAMYLFSTLMALIAAAVLSRTLFRAQSVPLILEMPPYRVPHWPSVLRMMLQRARSFLAAASGMILGCTIVLWLLLTFPRSAELEAQKSAEVSAIAALALPATELDARTAEIESRYHGIARQASYAGRLGQAFEPAIEPLGFDWKIGIGLIGAFAAREVFVSTMGVVYGVGGEADEESDSLRERLRAERHPDGRPVYTPLVGLSLMVFFALACQCISTLAAVYRETRSWRWPIFLFAYMTALAWLASFAIYQGGRALGFA